MKNKEYKLKMKKLNEQLRFRLALFITWTLILPTWIYPLIKQ